MRLNCFYKFMFLCHILFSANALANSCLSLGSFVPIPREGEATRIASTELVHLNEVQYLGIVVADSINVEFWVEQCITENGIEYSLFGTVSPSVLGKSKGAGFYDVIAIQNNQQFNGAFYFSNNLFVPGDFWTAMITTYRSSGSIVSIPSGLDLSQPFTLILSCTNSISFYEDCSAVNSVFYFELNPQLDIVNPTISSVNGTWFDPDYNGSGFNMVQTPAGFLIFFYGYKENSNGEALWLISSLGSNNINKGETFALDMLSGFLGNGGSLNTAPNTQNSGTIKWGTAEITFNTCNSGVIKLIKNNGISVTHNINIIADGIEGLTCID